MKMRRLEVRALPANEERRNTLVEKMNEIYLKAEKEERSLTEKEVEEFKSLEEEIRLLDETIAAEKTLRGLDKKENRDKDSVKEEEKRFLNYLRTGEARDLEVTDNKAIIPNSIANQIVEKIEELAVIFPACTKFFGAGELTFAVDNNDIGITAAYSEDMAEITESGTKFETVKLSNHIIGSLTKISRSLINNTTIDVLPYVVYKIAKAITDFIEKELISGSTKMSGLVTSKNITTTAKGGAITADELIDLQLSIPTTVTDACWVMNRKTLKAVRKLKTNDGEYLCGRMSEGFGFELLGKPIKVSDNMPDIGINKISVAYGDLSGMYVKFSQDIEVQVLLEKYATQHAIGILGTAECDSKIVEESKIAILKGAAA